MLVYIKRHTSHAGKWIYEGYKNAWSSLGYDVVFYDKITEIQNVDSGCYAMVLDSDLQEVGAIECLSKLKKSFLFAQPSIFPEPWGRHPNFVSNANLNIVKEVDKMENIYLWTFANVNQQFYPQWTKKIHTVPLAFDNISYIPEKDDRYKRYDICFVGGWANNGFNEKKRIMIDIFSKFKDSGLECGFFVNRNLSHQQECNLLANSKVALNIHDAYQRTLGLDTNERTFKSLGLNGLLVSDKVGQLEQMFPEVPVSLDTEKLIEHIKQFLDLTENETRVIKEENIQDVLLNHCYVNRVKQMLEG